MELIRFSSIFRSLLKSLYVSRTHWAPMDVEDALELLGPSWEYHDLRR